MVLVLILLPGFAKNYIVKPWQGIISAGRLKLKRSGSIILSSTVRIYNLKLFEPDEKEIFVSFDTLLVNLQPLNFIKNELVIEKFYLKGLYADIIQEDTSFNFDDIIAFLNKPGDSTETVKDTTPSKPLRFRMSEFDLKQAHIVYDDRNVNKATHLRDFSFNIPYIAWNQADKSEAGIRFSFAQEGYFESSLKIDPISGDYHGDVIIDRLHLDAFNEYISYYTNVQSLGGIFNCHVDVAGNINNVEESIVSGENVDPGPGHDRSEG